MDTKKVTYEKVYSRFGEIMKRYGVSTDLFTKAHNDNLGLINDSIPNRYKKKSKHWGAISMPKISQLLTLKANGHGHHQGVKTEKMARKLAFILNNCRKGFFSSSLGERKVNWWELMEVNWWSHIPELELRQYLVNGVAIAPLDIARLIQSQLDIIYTSKGIAEKHIAQAQQLLNINELTNDDLVSWSSLGVADCVLMSQPKDRAFWAELLKSTEISDKASSWETIHYKLTIGEALSGDIVVIKETDNKGLVGFFERQVNVDTVTLFAPTQNQGWQSQNFNISKISNKGVIRMSQYASNWLGGSTII